MKQKSLLSWIEWWTIIKIHTLSKKWPDCKVKRTPSRFLLRCCCCTSNNVTENFDTMILVLNFLTLGYLKYSIIIINERILSEILHGLYVWQHYSATQWLFYQTKTLIHNNIFININSDATTMPLQTVAATHPPLQSYRALCKVLDTRKILKNGRILTENV